MKKKGILHLRLFEYLIEKDGAFGYVQIKDFLLKNFDNPESEESRTRMSRFLKFMTSENYIEELSNQRGIFIHTENGKLIPKDEIYSVVRIKPKAVEIYNSYLNNRMNLNGMYLSIIISVMALIISAFGLMF